MLPTNDKRQMRRFSTSFAGVALVVLMVIPTPAQAGFADTTRSVVAWFVGLFDDGEAVPPVVEIAPIVPVPSPYSATLEPESPQPPADVVTSPPVTPPTPVYTTVVEEYATYVTNPTTIIRESSGGGGVSLSLFRNQVDQIYDSIGDMRSTDVVSSPGSVSWSDITGVQNIVEVGGFANTVGYITATALAPYLTTATAASTYLTITDAAAEYVATSTLATALSGYALVSHAHDADDITSGTFADARIASTSVTQHQSLLALDYSQISSVPSFLEDITGLVAAGTNVSLTGTGVSGDPYVVNAATAPGGSDTQIQYNNNGVLAGISELTWASSILGLSASDASIEPRFQITNSGDGHAAIRLGITGRSYQMGIVNDFGTSADRFTIAYGSTISNAQFGNNEYLGLQGTTGASRRLYLGTGDSTANIRIYGGASWSDTSVSGGILSQNYRPRIVLGGGGNAVMTASVNAVGVLVGDNTLTEAASGTHDIFANLAVRPLTITNGAGATTNAATLYVEGPSTGTATVTNNYSLWVDDGMTRLDGGMELTGTAKLTSLAGGGAVEADADGNLSVSSDESLKNIKGAFSRSITDLLGIEPILYHWKDETGKDTVREYAGFSAQNVQLAIPEAVGESPNGLLTLFDRPLLATAINAIKEIYAMVTGFADRFTTKMLCVEDICVTRDEFAEILQSANVQSAYVPQEPEPEEDHEPEEEEDAEGEEADEEILDEDGLEGENVDTDTETEDGEESVAGEEGDDEEPADTGADTEDTPSDDEDGEEAPEIEETEEGEDADEGNDDDGVED